MKFATIVSALALTALSMGAPAATYVAPASKINLFLDGKSGALASTDYVDPKANVRLVKDSAKSKITTAITGTTNGAVIYGDARGKAVSCGGTNFCASSSEANFAYGGQCVAFAKAMTKVVPTKSWHRGMLLPSAIDNLAQGTMIAFFDGKDVYPGDDPHAPGHVAIYLATVRDSRNVVTGIWVADQNGVTPALAMAKRLIPWSGTGRSGAKNFHVVEDRPFLMDH